MRTRFWILLAVLAAFCGTEVARAQSERVPGYPAIKRDREFQFEGKAVWVNWLNVAVADTNAVHSLYTLSSLSDSLFTFTSAESPLPTCTWVINGQAQTRILPRNIVLTLSGTQANVDVSTVTISGTNANGETITEDFALTENMAAGAITGAKAFATVSTMQTETQDGANVKLSVGYGDVLQLPYTLPINTVVTAWVSGTKEGTAPTVAVSASAIESNTLDFNTNADGTRDFIYWLVIPPFSSTSAASIW